MKVAILHSNYLPWTGVFELINSVDKFVFYDNVQFTKQDWRTRNKIQPDLWLSVPIHRQKLNTNIISIDNCEDTRRELVFDTILKVLELDYILLKVK